MKPDSLNQSVSRCTRKTVGTRAPHVSYLGDQWATDGQNAGPEQPLPARSATRDTPPRIPSGERGTAYRRV